MLVENHICAPLGGYRKSAGMLQKGEKTFEHRCVSPCLELCLNPSASINNNIRSGEASSVSEVFTVQFCFEVPSRILFTSAEIKKI